MNTTTDRSTSDAPGYDAAAAVEELTRTRRLLWRVRAVARRITQRVRKATGEDVPPAPAPDHLRPSVLPWRGESVMFRHHPDGTVAATSRGRVGAGWSEEEALRELDRLLAASAAPARPAAGPVDGSPWRAAEGAGAVDTRAAASEACQLLGAAVAYRQAGRGAEATDAAGRAAVIIAVAVAAFDRRLREIETRAGLARLRRSGLVRL
jgi:hypothetical protein